MRVESLSGKQRAVVRHAISEMTACFAGGAIRSGKSFSCVVGFGSWVLSEGIGFDHCLIGHSVETAMRNSGQPLLDYFESLGARAYFVRNLGHRIILEYQGRKTSIWVIGGSNRGAASRIQGATFKGMLIDEVVLVPEKFFMQAWGRLSVAGAKLWCSYNPEGPRHWFKRKVVDEIESFDGYVVNFALEDNPTLPPEVVNRYNRSFTGHFHDRLIRGLWVGASGLIFPAWRFASEALESDEWAFSLDWGVSSVFTSLGFETKGARADVVAELYHDARHSRPRSEGEHLEHFLAWAEGLCGSVRGKICWVDPNTPNSFKRSLRGAGMRVRNADNSVVPGIVTTSTRLARGEVRIHKACENLVKEISSYQWDADKSDIGEDAPMKQDDHTCDALRYFAHSTGKRLRAIPTTVRSILYANP